MHSLTTSILLVLPLIVLINGLPWTMEDVKQAQKYAITRNMFNCQEWYDGEPDPADYLAKTCNPPCNIPASFPRTLKEGWTVDPGCDPLKQPDTCGYHKGAHGCYRHAYESSGPGAQACYDENGQWISDPWLGAGTLDVETPLGGLWQSVLHGLVDVITYEGCCAADSGPQPYTCNLYYEKRPPGQCEDKPAV